MTEEQAEYTIDRDLEKYDSRQSGAVQVVPPPNYLSVVERLAANKDVDVDKLQKIIDMQNNQLDREAEQAFNADMVLAQAEIKTVAKNQTNAQTHSEYADLEAIIKSAKPIYTKYGFALSFYEGDSKGDLIRIMVDVMHREGHTKVRHSDFAVDDVGIAGKKNKTAIHGKGSTFAYGRRYLTCMIFNIPTGDDDDGCEPEPTITEEQAAEMAEKADAAKVDEKAFCKYFGIKEFFDLPANKYKAAMNMIAKKAEKNADN